MWAEGHPRFAVEEGDLGVAEEAKMSVCVCPVDGPEAHGCKAERKTPMWCTLCLSSGNGTSL